MKKVFFGIVFTFIAVLGWANPTPFGTKLILTELNGNAVTSSKVYLTINKEEKSMSGKSGCNTFVLSYTEKRKDTCIETGLSMGTMMACDEETMALEFEFLNTLKERKLNIKTKGNKVQFKNWWGKTIMEFEAQTNESAWNFIQKNKWKLLMMNNIGKDYKGVSLQIDSEENRIYGNAGCNNFTTTYERNGKHITFHPLSAVTLRACLDEEANHIEKDFINLINGKTLNFDLADQTLNFYDEGRLVLMFGLTNE